MWVKWVVAGLVFSVLPIWRDSLHPLEGRTLWDYFIDVHTKEYYDSHIPYAEAVAKAREAWNESQQ